MLKKMILCCARSTFLDVGTLFMVAFWSVQYIDIHATSCVRHSCHGDVGNLASGRVVSASSTCSRGDDLADDAVLTRYCHFEDDRCGEPKCAQCGESHQASKMLDTPFSMSRTYWQSKLLKSDEEKVTISFDLETTFYFTHLIMVFKTPRPGAMVLERSVDFGKTWQMYQQYAKDCRKTFGVHTNGRNFTGSCTESYSSEEPCTEGEVIYRVLNPTDSTNDPYRNESKYLLNVTNLRIQMWMPQICSKCNISERNMASFRHFAVYDLIIRGTCFCNGHADSCVAFDKDGFQSQQSLHAVVHGKCMCEHNTGGNHCEKCLPLYNDAPWRPGNGYTGQPNYCKKCECNSHAETCHFDQRILSLTGQNSGGVCDNCMHNTTGRHCDRCKMHYFRRVDSDISDPDVCQECDCHANGTVAIDDVDGFGNLIHATMPCDSASGQCECKVGVTGRRCDRCQKGFWGLSEHGCRICLCDIGVCDQVSGGCLPDYHDELFLPTSYRQSSTDPYHRFPDKRLTPSFLETSELDHAMYMPVSSRRHNSCICKEKEIRNTAEFCKENYDYAIKVRVLGAKDNGAMTLVSVALRRIIKQGNVKLTKRKMYIYPESWTTMGCTCPALIPGNDYVIVGHEDREANRLLVNMDSVVKRWNRRKQRNRIISRIRRSHCQ